MTKDDKQRLLAGICLIACATAVGLALNWMRRPLPPAPMPGHASAGRYFDEAFAIMVEPKKVSETRPGAEAVGPLTAAQVQWLATANLPAFHVVVAGLHHRYAEPMPGDSMMSLPPHFAEHGTLGRLVALESAEAARRGDYADAARDAIDDVALGNSLRCGATLLSAESGIACASCGRRECWPLVDRISGPEACRDALRLEDLLDTRRTAESVVHHDRIGEERVLRHRLESGEAYSFYAPDGDASSFAVFLMVMHPPWSVFGRFDRRERLLEQYAAEPYAAHARLPEPDPGESVFAPELSVDGNFLVEDCSDRAYTEMLMTQLALHAYRADQGHYPSSLDQLVPTYLRRVPQDPFAVDAALRYRIAGRSYILYSIGPDCVDNGGAPFRATLTGGRVETTFAFADTHGDIVAGVNRG